MFISSVARVQIYIDLTPFDFNCLVILTEAYFHNFVSLSTKTPLLKLKTIAECGVDSKRWHDQQQFCHYIL